MQNRLLHQLLHSAEGGSSLTCWRHSFISRCSHTQVGAEHKLIKLCLESRDYRLPVFFISVKRKFDALCSAGLSVVVLQSGDEIARPGVTVTLECRMGAGSMSSYTMLWYQQHRHGAQMKFLLKEYDQTVGRFQSSIDPGANSFSLRITELVLDDSSTYFCAARHSGAARPITNTNNQSVARPSGRKELWLFHIRTPI